MPGVSKKGKLQLKISPVDPGIEPATDPESRRALRRILSVRLRGLAKDSHCQKSIENGHVKSNTLGKGTFN